MNTYPDSFYHEKTYTISWAEGEVKDLFGDVNAMALDKRPTITFDLDDKLIKFDVKNAVPAPGRDFVAEAGKARFVTAKSMRWWPSPHGMIIGFLNRGKVGTQQQLFMMWVTPKEPLTDLESPLELRMFFFNTNDCFSGGPSEMDGSHLGAGQINGGGIGNGPNKKS
jgi:hypothetical protein